MALNDLLELGFPAIQALVGMNTTESLTLEFKRKASPTDAELSKDDRKALGEAISGFANAVGGTLIIGVATERKNGIDQASEVIQIANVTEVAARYAAYANECVSPPVEGLTTRAIVSSERRGIVVIQVPRGQSRPHMSTAPGHHTYYRRVADSFLPMQHYEVEEMMRLKTEPKLELVHQLIRNGISSGNRSLGLQFGLGNTSRVTARFPYVEYMVRPRQPGVAEYGLDGNGGTLWKTLNRSSSANIVFAATADEVLHPGQKFFVSKLEMMERETSVIRWRWGIDQLNDGESLILSFGYGCEDCPKETATLSFTKEELLAAL